MKYVIFDSGPLINLSMNGLLNILTNLKKSFQGEFLITKPVFNEVCERPLKIPQFELGALNIKNLLENKIIRLPENKEIAEKELDRLTKEAMDCANRTFKAHGNWINIVSDGEMSCIALSQHLKKNGHQTLLVIDERTARLLCEDPKRIEKLMLHKLHTEVSMEEDCVSKFLGLNCIRSSELVYVAYKKNLINLKDSRTLEALVYATKFKGAAISWEEINQLKKQ